jgi:NAD(P)-dependent dehydrogenase (short-subunit alcohol dehydrogenase family)
LALHTSVDQTYAKKRLWCHREHPDFGRRPTPKGFAAYLTAKHALRGLTLALAAEYAERGVRVFSVSPGFMDTPLTKRWDSRLREIIRANSLHVSDPIQAAKRLVELVDNKTAVGQGEDYPI